MIKFLKDPFYKPLDSEVKKFYFYNDSENQSLPDVFDLFQFYNDFFYEGLLGSVELKWSQRMTLCAGTCELKHGFCKITLSKPILEFRNNNELKETLLHEMIHAYLMMTNPRCCLAEGGHGKEFKEIMNAINLYTGLNVTIYHNFHDEVDNCRKHVWKCNGICKDWPPYYGIVKRAMNRAPGPNDNWYKEHQQKCGGVFEKISEPEKKPNKKDKKAKDKENIKKINSLDSYFQVNKKENSKKENPFEPQQTTQNQFLNNRWNKNTIQQNENKQPTQNNNNRKITFTDTTIKQSETNQSRQLTAKDFFKIQENSIFQTQNKQTLHDISNTQKNQQQKMEIGNSTVPNNNTFQKYSDRIHTDQNISFPNQPVQNEYVCILEIKLISYQNNNNIENQFTHLDIRENYQQLIFDKYKIILNTTLSFQQLSDTIIPIILGKNHYSEQVLMDIQIDFQDVEDDIGNLSLYELLLKDKGLDTILDLIYDEFQIQIKVMKYIDIQHKKQQNRHLIDAFNHPICFSIQNTDKNEKQIQQKCNDTCKIQTELKKQINFEFYNKFYTS